MCQMNLNLCILRMLKDTFLLGVGPYVGKLDKDTRDPDKAECQVNAFLISP